MKYQTLNNRFDPIPVKVSKKSITVPDMSFTPREIISKFSRGEKVPLGFQGLYDSEDSEDDPKFRGYDPDIFVDDPTRDSEFDFGDYVEEKHALEERIRRKAVAALGKADPSSKRKASDEEASASEPMKRETTSGDDGTAPPPQDKA